MILESGHVPCSVVAQLHAADMAAGNYFNHYSQNGSSPYDRVSAAFPAVQDMAEVEAAGWTSVRAVLVQLMWWELFAAPHFRRLS